MVAERVDEHREMDSEIDDSATQDSEGVQSARTPGDLAKLIADKQGEHRKAVKAYTRYAERNGAKLGELREAATERANELSELLAELGRAI